MSMFNSSLFPFLGLGIDSPNKQLPARKNSLVPSSAFDPFDIARWFDPFDKSNTAMQCDIRDLDDKYVLEAELPGIPKESIKIEASEDNGTVCISYDNSQENDEEDKGYIRKERMQVSGSRMFAFDDILADDIKASMDNGVLTIEIPKAKNEEEEEAPQPKLIEIA